MISAKGVAVRHTPGPIADLLAEIPFWTDLHVPAGQVVLRHDDPGDALIMVASGRLEVVNPAGTAIEALGRGAVVDARPSPRPDRRAASSAEASSSGSGRRLLTGAAQRRRRRSALAPPDEDAARARTWLIVTRELPGFGLLD